MQLTIRTALAVIAATALTAGTAAASPPRTPSHAQARAALQRAEDLRNGKGVRTGRELTPALNQLFAALPSLSGDDRLAAEALLERPDDSQQDPVGTHKYNVPPSHIKQSCTAHFCVHWIDISNGPGGGDEPSLADNVGANGQPGADGVPDYVDQMSSILENEVSPCENATAPDACSMSGGSFRLTGTTPGLGWTSPAPDNGIDGGDQLDVYIENLFPSGVFGYVALDPGQTQDPSIPHYGYLVLDKDFSRFVPPGSSLTGTDEMRVTIAHEYNHVLQNAYDYLEDSWMFESTAVYMEDKVYPQINDYLQYLPSWTGNTKLPLTRFQTSKPYGSAVWNHWLDHEFGPNVVRGAWEDSVGAGDFAPGAYTAGIAGLGGTGFADEFDRFSAAVAEWNAPGSGFPDLYPDVPRDGSLAVGSITDPFNLPHTTFAFFDVPIPAGAPPAIRLDATLPAGTAGAIALVGRTGSDPAGGAVTSNLTQVGSDGRAAVILTDPSSFGRITAIVVNADPTKSGFDQSTGDWIFTKDASGVTAQLDGPDVPVVTTGAASAITDHAAHVDGAVDPHLLDTTWHFEYGRTLFYGARTPDQPLPAATLAAVPVGAPLTGLAPRTIYHYRIVASNAAGSSAGPDMTFTTAPDVTPPTLRLVAARRQKLRKARARGVALAAACSERCTGTARLRLDRRTAKRLRLARGIGVVRVSLAPRLELTPLRVRLSRVAGRKLASEKRVPVTLVVSVADSSGNRRTASRKIVLTR